MRRGAGRAQEGRTMPLRIRFPRAMPPSAGFLHQGSAQGPEGHLQPLREASRFLVSKKGHRARVASNDEYSVRNDLANWLPILHEEIALLETALSEFLASPDCTVPREDRTDRE